MLSNKAASQLTPSVDRFLQVVSQAQKPSSARQPQRIEQRRTAAGKDFLQRLREAGL